MKAVFLGGHPAIDFLNTIFSPQGITTEIIGDGESLLRWMVSAKLVDTPAAASIRRSHNGATLDAIAADARKLRSWAAGWIDRWSRRPLGNYTNELRRLNALLERSHSYWQVEHLASAVTMVQHQQFLDAGELLALLAAQIAFLITNEDSKLVKRCSGASCTLLFLDGTKAHRRLFCSPAACGNRAKVAAFRNRQRG
jgi:predicted RNA-binding Zn ribbon-like protein